MPPPTPSPQVPACKKPDSSDVPFCLRCFLPLFHPNVAAQPYAMANASIRTYEVEDRSTSPVSPIELRR